MGVNRLYGFLDFLIRSLSYNDSACRRVIRYLLVCIAIIVKVHPKRFILINKPAVITAGSGFAFKCRCAFFDHGYTVNGVAAAELKVRFSVEQYIKRDGKFMSCRYIYRIIGEIIVECDIGPARIPVVLDYIDRYMPLYVARRLVNNSAVLQQHA